MEIAFSRKIALLGVGLLLVFAVNFAFGQGITTGSISGTAEDQQHAVISGATVTATQAGTNQKYTTHTGSTGYFSIQSLPTGTYSVSIEAARFSKLTINNVTVSIGVDNSLGARILSIGTQEVVTVEETTPLVETNSAQITTTMNARKVSQLPLGTNFDSLALLVPGASDPGDNSFSNGTNLQNVSMNGQRGRSNNFQLDGQNNNDNSVAGPKYSIENPDLIGEFQVVSNNFSAEYGRNMGSVINYVTKSGSNAWHGSAYEAYSGNFTDSLANQEKSPLLGFCLQGQDPATTGCNKPVLPKYVQNRFGATFGGPIKHDKAWFFMSFAGDRQRQALSDTTGSSGTVTPTPAGLAILENTYCGLAVTSYTPNPCPSHPGLGALLVNGPYANPVGSPQSGSSTNQTVSDGTTSVSVPFATVSRQVPEPANLWETSGRADWQVTSKDRIFGRYVFQDSTFLAGAGRFAAGAWVDTPFRSQDAGVDWVRNWTSNFVNQTRFNYSRLFAGFEGAAGTPFASCTVTTISACPVGISFQNGTTAFGYQNNLPQDRLVNDSELKDNATGVHGKHTVKFGGE